MTLEMINLVVTIVILLAVTLATGQMIVFDLKAETARKSKYLGAHILVAYLGMGAAAYACFAAHVHFSTEGWVGLVVGVLGIVASGVMIQKFRRRNDPRERVPEEMIVSRDPDETVSWCRKCLEHTLPRKERVYGSSGGSWTKEVCAHCGGGVHVPAECRKMAWGCSGCAAVPVLVAAIVIACTLGQSGIASLVASLTGLLLIIIMPFPAFGFYYYRRWLRWSRQRYTDPYF